MQIDNAISAAEVYQFGSEQSKIPSVWLIHLPIVDLAESLRRVTKGCGEVFEVHSESKHTIIRDPVGVFMALQTC